MSAFRSIPFLLAHLALASIAWGQATNALEFSLDSARFIERATNDHPEVELQIDIKVKNISERTYWFDAQPKTPDDTTFKFNEYESITGVRQSFEGMLLRSKRSEISERTALKPSEAGIITVRSLQSRQRFAEFTRFGVPVSLSEVDGTATLWSREFRGLMDQVLDKLGVLKHNLFAGTHHVHKITEREFDEMLRLRKDVHTDLPFTQMSHGTAEITDGKRRIEGRSRSLSVTTEKELVHALKIAGLFPEVVELRLGGRAIGDASKEVKDLIKSLPMLNAVILTKNTPRSILSVLTEIPKLERLAIWGNSPEFGELVSPSLAKTLGELPRTLRSISVSGAHLHPTCFRALANNTQLEQLTVGEVDDDASVLSGLTIEDFRPMKNRKLLRLYVNCVRGDWTKAEVKEFDGLMSLVRKRGQVVRSIRDGRRRVSATVAKPVETAYGASIGPMSESEYENFLDRRDELVLTLFNSESRKLVFSNVTFPPIAVHCSGRSISLSRRRLEARDVTEGEAKQIANALPFFPDIACLSITMKNGSSVFPVELLCKAELLPDLRWLFVHTTNAWPADALRLAASHSRLERLNVNIDDKPESKVAFRALSRLKSLERLDFHAPSADCFETLASLPQLRVSYMTLGSQASTKPITDSTRTAVAKLNGRPMTIGIKGYCHPSLVRSLWSIESMRSLSFMAHAREAKVDDFRGVEKLRTLEYLTLSPISVDDATRTAVSKIEAENKRRLKARTARDRRRDKAATYLNRHVGKADVTDEQVANWIGEMATQGRQFSPAPLLIAGDPALEAMLRRVLPEGFRPKTELTKDAVLELIGQLNDEAFLAREHAMKQLVEKARSYRSLIESELGKSNPEVQQRLRGVLSIWDRPSDTFKSHKFNQAWKRYVGGLSEISSDAMLADVCAEAILRGVHKSDRANLLTNSLHVLAKSHEHDIRNRFTKLCDLETPDAAIFVLERIGGSTVSPFHRACLKSDNWRLKRSALRHLPPPIRDPKLRADVNEAVAMMFAPDAKREVTGDNELDRDVLASVHRRVPSALDHLLSVTKSDNAERAARAITFLSDSQFFRQPLPDKVDSAVEVASQSKHRQVRLAVAESLQIFKLRQSDLPMLLRLLDDANEDVWHAATNGLLWQQTWVRQGESKLKLIESLERHAKQLDEKLRARNQIIQDIVNRKAEFDWVDWPN